MSPKQMCTNTSLGSLVFAISTSQIHQSKPEKILIMNLPVSLEDSSSQSLFCNSKEISHFGVHQTLYLFVMDFTPPCDKSPLTPAYPLSLITVDSFLDNILTALCACTDVVLAVP